MKKIISLCLLLFLLACAPQALPTSEDTTSQNEAIPATESNDEPSPVASETEPADPTEPTAFTKTATATLVKGKSTATPTPDLCLALLSPENGSRLPLSGQVAFQWKPRQGTQAYVLTLISPTGSRAQFRTTDTRIKRFVPATTRPEPHQWSVTAYDSEGQVICDSGSFTFTRLSATPSVTATSTFIVPPTGSSTITPSDTPTLPFILPPTTAYTPTMGPTPTHSEPPGPSYP